MPRTVVLSSPEEETTMTKPEDLRTFTFSGPGDTMHGTTTVRARTEADARHKAMLARWDRPNNRPAPDTDSDGRYLSHGLSLMSVS